MSSVVMCGEWVTASWPSCVSSGKPGAILRNSGAASTTTLPRDSSSGKEIDAIAGFSFTWRVCSDVWLPLILARAVLTTSISSSTRLIWSDRPSSHERRSDDVALLVVGGEVARGVEWIDETGRFDDESR